MKGKREKKAEEMEVYATRDTVTISRTISVTLSLSLVYTHYHSSQLVLYIHLSLLSQFNQVSLGYKKIYHIHFGNLY